MYEESANINVFFCYTRQDYHITKEINNTIKTAITINIVVPIPLKAIIKASCIYSKNDIPLK